MKKRKHQIYVISIGEFIMLNQEKKPFIRHPSEIPIEIGISKSTCKNRGLSHFNLGGLIFESNQNWQRGSLIGIRIPLIDPMFETTGQVVWCKNKTTYFDVGVEMTDKEDAFRVRMVEQACQIESYKNRLKQQGRNLTTNEAAMEWISEYAADFSPV
jgi:Tfp pilus assembly protein PilZ